MRESSIATPHMLEFHRPRILTCLGDTHADVNTCRGMSRRRVDSRRFSNSAEHCAATINSWAIA
jgi:hypothetical protein